MIRAAALFALTIVLLMTVTGGIVAQHPQPAVQTERRFTTLEVKVEAMAADIRDIKDSHKWEVLKSIAMAALASLGGYDAVRRRKKPE